jgi:DNA-binding response OmpR family regulator
MGVKNISQIGGSDSAVFPRELNPPPRILVVDGEPGVRQTTTEVLIHSGFEVDAAADGATAWEALIDDIFYDLLIADNDVPNVSGVELLKKLRAARMVLPVIMTTGTLPARELPVRPWLKPAAMLVKPYTVEHLLGTVKNVLRATDLPRAQIAPPTDQRSLPPAGGQRT